MAEVNILLHNLTVESKIVHNLAQVGRAQLICVAVCNIKTTRVTHIPICVLFDNVGIQLPMIVGLFIKGHARGILWDTISAGATEWRITNWRTATRKTLGVEET